MPRPRAARRARRRTARIASAAGARWTARDRRRGGIRRALGIAGRGWHSGGRGSPARAPRAGAARSGWRSGSCSRWRSGLRLWGIKQGLPYSYNSDEDAHFVPRAIGIFALGWNPHYFANPPAFTYLLHFVFALWFGGEAGGHAHVRDEPDRGLRAGARGRRAAGHAGDLAAVPRGRAPLRSRGRAAGGGAGGGRVPAGLLLAPRAQRRARRSRR